MSYEKALAVGVNNVNEAPTATGEIVSISKNTSNPVANITVDLADNIANADANGLSNAVLNVTGTTNGKIASIDQDARLITFLPHRRFFWHCFFQLHYYRCRWINLQCSYHHCGSWGHHLNWQQKSNYPGQ